MDTITGEEPDYRITVRDGRVTLTGWGQWLAEWGPFSALLRGRGRAGVTIGNLTIVRDQEDAATEAVVRILCGGDEPALRAITDWARTAGYERLWLPDRLVETGGDERFGGAARTRCPACGARWSEDSLEFWQMIRELGVFPVACALCGGDLPQWTVPRPTKNRSRRPARHEARRTRR